MASERDKKIYELYEMLQEITPAKREAVTLMLRHFNAVQVITGIKQPAPEETEKYIYELNDAGEYLLLSLLLFKVIWEQEVPNDHEA